MPRLLLVDDNPSIHKIAETLLAGSDIELVCAASGAQALDLLHGEVPFDVAMLDISMLGMDGWDLLARLREDEATALLPVAMMAGVLDVVDPERLRLAPIQGFLKKPVELRDLGDRVMRLMETPVLPPEPEAVPEPAFVAEAQAIPEPEAGPGPDVDPGAFRTVPGMPLADPALRLERPEEISDDLLILGPEDLFPEEPSLEAPEAFAPSSEDSALEEPLDLEELDLESLRDLTLSPESFGDLTLPPESQPEPEPEAPQADLADLEDFSRMDDLMEPESPREEVAPPQDLLAIPDFAPGDAFSVTPPLPDPPAPAPADEIAAGSEEGPESFPGQDLQESLPAGTPPAPEIPEVDFLDWSEDSDSMLQSLPLAQEPAPLENVEENPAVLDLDLISEAMLSVEMPTFLEEGDGQPPPLEPAPPVSLLPEPAPLDPPKPSGAPEVSDPLAALLADPVLMDRLAKALVSRLGDQVLREIAWEVMPELADRIRRD